MDGRHPVNVTWTDWGAALLMAGTCGGLLWSIWLELGNGDATGNLIGLSGVGFLTAVTVLPLCGGLIALRRPGNLVGWLLAGGGAVVAAGLVAHGWAVRALLVDPGGLPFARPAAWFATWLLVPGFALFAFSIARFPGGSIPGRGIARLERVAVAACAVLSVAQAVAPDELDGVAPGLRIDNPFGVVGLEGVVTTVSTTAFVVLAGFVVVAAVELVVRSRRSSGLLRVQVRWLALPLLGIPVGIAASIVAWSTGVPGAVDPTLYVSQAIVFVGLAVALTVAVLRDDVFASQRVVDRTLVYALLSGMVAATFLVLVALIGAVSSRSGSMTATVAAVAVAALALTPLRGWMQRRVNRVVYGASADPFATIDAVIARLDAATQPVDAADTVVGAVREAMGLAYVAVEYNGHVIAAHGSPLGHTTREPMIQRGQVIGALVVGNRPPRDGLTARDTALLRRLARQVGPALEAQQLAREVKTSRAQVVLGREDERRRLRHELHDGVGPALAGISLQLDTLRATLHDDPATAVLLDQLCSDLAGSVAEVRRIVSGLRPTVLEDLGLHGAIRARAHSFDPQVAIRLDIPASLPELSAAAEVAIYRITSEALANVARHANATTCDIRLRVVDSHVELAVTDDGVGMDQRPAGVGLASMRARASELGGTIEFADLAPHGTAVRAAFPALP